MKGKEQIEKVVEAYIKGVESGDAEAFRAIWTGHDNTLISIAKRYDGIDCIVNDFLLKGIHGAYASIRLIAESVDIHLVNDTTAVVIFGYHTECIRRGSNEPYGIQGLETQVIVKEGSSWLLQHVHYSK